MSATRSRSSTKATSKPAAKKAAPAKTTTKRSVFEILARMDALLPKWKQYNEDRKAKVPRDKRRGQKEYVEFEKLYTALRKSGLRLKDARESVAKS
jgi:hypothetical protein